MNNHRCLRALCALPLALAAVGAEAADWSVEWMPAFGGSALSIRDLNDRGQLVGVDVSGPYNGTSRAFLYSGGTLTDLSGTLGLGATANAINNHGEITGTVGDNVYRYDRGTVTTYQLIGVRETPQAIDSQGRILASSSEPERQYAFIIDGAGSITQIQPTPGYTNVAAMHMNDRGEATGTLRNFSSAGSQAFIYRDGQMTSLMPQAQISWATDISESGRVAFNYHHANGNIRAAVWHNGVIADLGTLGGGSSSVHAVNSNGEAVGSSMTPTGSASFLYSYGSLINLNEVAGGARVFVQDINDQGVVVGTFEPLGTSDRHLFAYVDGQIIDVTRWLMASFDDVASVSNWYGDNLLLNDVGQLAATAMMNDGSSRVFIVSSVPEPALGLMLLLGLVPLAVLRRKG